MVVELPWLEYHEVPQSLHSGGTSHWIVRGDVIFADPHLRESVLKYWIRQLSWRHDRGPLKFFGIPEGGIPWAIEIAGRMRGEFITEFKSGCVVVDDVTTTGNSFSRYPGSPRLVVVSRNSNIRVMAAWCTIEL